MVIETLPSIFLLNCYYYINSSSPSTVKMLLSFRKLQAKLTNKDRLFGIGMSLGSGVLMGITFAPVEAWYFAWVAIAPLWYLIVRRDRSSEPIVHGLCWGVGCYGLALSWIFGIHPMTWMGVPYLASLGIATFCLTFITC
jgi:apolipoprotein N-acyltransferase